MDGRGIEIIVSDENDARVSTVQSGKRAVLRRIWMVLLDNRVAGRPDCERALRPHPEEYRVLKKVLNISFITIGVALLLSVVLVIIYTYVGSSNKCTAKADGNGTICGRSTSRFTTINAIKEIKIFMVSPSFSLSAAPLLPLT
ncbi:mitochondrial fission factor-like protein b [Plakobranchus ocellatus]|uniref:Mitochondrial fission factor-like protein b n=1 Tax=Plakobranchus ocellatus TaxID=259542 RepID=A0AAV4CDH3_9GAST|nr:mitochondrial fission factor-like protein b [Plakobranchus ocellatus]